MKNILFILPVVVLVLSSLLSCQNGDTKEQSKTEITVKIEQKSEDFRKVQFEFKKLYNELLEFKSSGDFVKSGFSQEGNYNKWLKDVEALNKNPNAELLLDNSLIVGDLLNLGMAYVNSKGKETTVTKELDTWISDNLLEEQPLLSVVFNCAFFVNVLFLVLRLDIWNKIIYIF